MHRVFCSVAVGFLLLATLLILPDLQAKTTEVSDYAEQVWLVADGLPSSQVKSLLQAQDGFLWLGTQEGLAKFDGNSFSLIERRTLKEMRGQMFIAVAQGSDGSIWFSNGHGLSRYQKDRVDYYNITDLVFSLCRDHAGTIWAGTDKGLRRFEKDSFVAVETNLFDGPIRALLADRSGNIWIGGSNGVHRYRDGKITSFTREKGFLPDDGVLALAEGRSGRIWVGTTKGLTLIDGGQTHQFQAEDGLINTSVRSLFCDSTGTLWVGTYAGLQRMFGERAPLETFQSFSSSEFANGTPEYVYSIFEDLEHNIWIGSNIGLKRLKPRRFATYSTTEGLPHRIIASVIEDQHGTIWVGGVNGISRIKEPEVIAGWGTRNGRLTRANILSLMEDRGGEIWIGTDNGVYRIVEKTNLLHYLSPQDGLPDSVARVVFQSSDRRYWVGNNTAVSVFEQGRFTNLSARLNLTFNNVKAIAEDRDHRLWIGSEDGVTTIRGNEAKRYTMQEGLSSDLVNSLYVERSGTLWIGTDNGGLNRFQNGRFTAIAPTAGLFSERIFSIVEDDSENLWMGSRNGIFRVSKADLEHYLEGRIHNVNCTAYGRSDGIRNPQCSSISQPAAWKSRDGRLWFATLDGVVVTDPKRVKDNVVPPRLILKQVVVDGQPRLPTSGLKLPPGNGNFEFRYTGICLQAPEKMRFKYMLKGWDPDWIDAGDHRMANYSSIPPGEYNFLLRACNNDNVWNDVPLSFAFVLEPRFYQTYTFYGACLVVILALSFGVHNYRIRVMRRREQEMTRLIQKKTEHLQETLKAMETFTYSLAHDLRAPLRAIRGLTQALFEDYGTKFDSVATDYSRRIELAAERMDQLIQDMLVYGQLAHSDVPLSAVDLEMVIERMLAEVEPQIALRKAVVEIRRPLPKVTANATLLGQVLINLVSNAIKFVPADTVPDVRIWTERYYGNVRIFVRDNGIGIRADYHERIFHLFERLHTGYAGTGVGLAIVRKGMERMAGRVGVESEPGKGACFWIELPKASEMDTRTYTSPVRDAESPSNGRISDRASLADSKPDKPFKA